MSRAQQFEPDEFTSEFTYFPEAEPQATTSGPPSTIFNPADGASTSAGSHGHGAGGSTSGYAFNPPSSSICHSEFVDNDYPGDFGILHPTASDHEMTVELHGHNFGVSAYKLFS
jgi:hypothetical protein